MNVGASVDRCVNNADKLFRTGESRSSNKTRLSLLGTGFYFRIKDFSDAVINHFNNGRTAAWIRLQHDIRWLDVAMHYTARFCGRERTRSLLDYFEREWEGEGSFAADLGFERFAFDQLHHIEAFAILFAVMTHARDVRMMNLRSRARFTQKARPYAGSLSDFPINHFQRDRRIQNGIARAIRDCHCTGPELNWKSIGTDFHFKVIVSQPGGRESTSVLL